VLMDPLAITVATKDILGTCVKVSGYILTYFKKVQQVLDASITLLRKEASSLSSLLAAIDRSFEDPVLARTPSTTPVRYDWKYWQSVKHSMDNCQHTLRDLEHIMEGVKGGVLGRKIRFEIKAEEIESYRKHVIGKPCC
jgi:hypothetical protein